MITAVQRETVKTRQADRREWSDRERGQESSRKEVGTVRRREGVKGKGIKMNTYLKCLVTHPGNSAPTLQVPQSSAGRRSPLSMILGTRRWS